MNDKVNVQVVFDIGSCMGDFVAYAASGIKPKLYAFEPSEQTGVSQLKEVTFQKKDEEFVITTIDDFVKGNNLSRVDFIKADIEGFERHMLAGAQETLARFSPKLELCTYN